MEVKIKMGYEEKMEYKELKEEVLDILGRLEYEVSNDFYNKEELEELLRDLRGGAKKKLYRVLWSAKIYGESVVEATSKEEARRLAEQGKDKGFERLEHTDLEWEIEEVTEVEEH